MKDSAGSKRIRNFFRDTAFRFGTILPTSRAESLLRSFLNLNGYGATSISVEVKHFSKLVSQQRIGQQPSGFTILDVGASSGFWTKRFLEENPSAYLKCFEPSSTSFQSLKDNVSDLRRANVTLHPIGLADKPGFRHLCASSPGSGSATISNLGEYEHIFCEEVEVTSLDLVLSLYPEARGIKFDVEGAEWEILSASNGLLHSNVSIIQFEFGENTISQGVRFKDFFDFFENLGFQLFRSCPKKLAPVSQYEAWHEIHINTVYFALRLDP